MRYKVSTVVYWIIGLMIALGSYGHGFIGVMPIRAAIEASTIPYNVRQVIWIVWYCTSAAFLVFGALTIWAWFAARNGMRAALTVPLVIGTLWLAEGIGAYTYQHDTFWLLFVVEGALLLAATLGLRQSRVAA